MTRWQKADTTRAALLFAAKIVEGGLYSPGPERTVEQALQEAVTMLRSHAHQAAYEIEATGKYGTDRYSANGSEAAR